MKNILILTCFTYWLHCARCGSFSRNVVSVIVISSLDPYMIDYECLNDDD